MYPVDRQDSVISGPRVPLGLARLSPFSPPRTLGSGGTQAFHAPKHPWNWRDSVRSGPQVALGLAGLAISAPQVPLGRARLSHFSPPSTLETGSSEGLLLGSHRVPRTGTGTLTIALTIHSEQDSLVCMAWLQVNGGLDSAKRV